MTNIVLVQVPALTTFVVLSMPTCPTVGQGEISRMGADAIYVAR